MMTYKLLKFVAACSLCTYFVEKHRILFQVKGVTSAGTAVRSVRSMPLSFGTNLFTITKISIHVVTNVVFKDSPRFGFLHTQNP